MIVIAKELGASDIDIGLIFSIGGIGGVVGSLVGGQIQKRFTFSQVIIAVCWALALLFPLYLLVPRFALLGVVYALIYMTGPVYNVVQFSYRLALIPDALLGASTARSGCRIRLHSCRGRGIRLLAGADRKRCDDLRLCRVVRAPGGDDDVQSPRSRGTPAGTDRRRSRAT